MKTRPRDLIHSKISHFVIVLILLIFIGAVGVFNLDRIAVFCLNHFTACKISYDKWDRPSFGRALIEGAHIELKDKKLLINAEEIHLDLKISRLLMGGELLLVCEMKDVSFLSTNGDSLASGSADALKFFLNPERPYKRVTFKVSLHPSSVMISDFMVDSENVRINGFYAYFKHKNEISIDLKLSFSPEASNALGSAIKENMLELDDDGWYGTVINYKGNAALLKAIYQFAAG